MSTGIDAHRCALLIFDLGGAESHRYKTGK